VLKLFFEFHKLVDALSEEELGSDKIGTTKQGIGPCFSDKVNRRGLRITDLSSPDLKESLQKILRGHQKRYSNSLALAQYDIDAEVIKLREFYRQIEPYVVDTIFYLNKAYSEGKTILIEGANATMLDIDFGTYPYVTSSTTAVAGVFCGLGLSPNKLDCSIGIIKGYTSRVGEGAFPTELTDEIGEKIRTIGKEFGTTTGRPRRCGWLDLVVVKYTHLINGYKYLNLTKIDILTGFKTIKVGLNYLLNGKKLDTFPANLGLLNQVEVEYLEMEGWSEDISKCKTFEQLPINCQKYVQMIEKEVGVPIKWIGVGAERDEMIERKDV